MEKTRPEKKRRRLPALARLALLVFLLIMFIRWFEHRQVYHPFRHHEANANELGRPFEDVFFTAGDNVKLHGWFFPADTSSPRRHLAFLVCHGNGDNVSHRLELSSVLLDLGASVFVFDYRGYGLSAGRPDEEGTYRDAQAAHGWLRQKGFEARHIVALGESLGGAVASELALRETLGAVVLQNTFTSIADVGADLFPWLPVRLINRIKYDTINKLPRITVPVLIMHSRSDRLITYHHAERNFEAANEPKVFCELSGDHNEALIASGERYAGALDRLLENLEAGGGGKERSDGVVE